MTSAEIIGAMLRRLKPLIAIVPVERIKGGRMPDGTPMPWLLVREVSIIDWRALRSHGWYRSTARVSVMVRAASYAEQLEVMKLVRQLPQGAIGTVGDASSVVVHTAGGGPDVLGPADTFEKTQDFRVGFDTTE